MTYHPKLKLFFWYKYGNLRCLFCRNIETFSKTITEDSIKINHHLGCTDKHLIYLDFVDTTLKRVIGDFYVVKRLNRRSSYTKTFLKLTTVDLLQSLIFN